MKGWCNVIIKPTYALFVWIVEGGRLYFSVIENMGIQECIKLYEYREIFSGRAATVYTFFNDYDLHRNDLMAAADRYMKGDYARLDVNLKTGELIVTKGVVKINPRQ